MERPAPSGTPLSRWVEVRQRCSRFAQLSIRHGRISSLFVLGVRASDPKAAAGASCKSWHVAVRPAHLGRLSDGFAGEIVGPDDPGYDAARAVWNSMIDRRPALIVRPTGTDDVAAALRFGREPELLIAVRCGGHSIPGFSTCADGIVIDLSRMRGVEVDAERRTARVRGGSLLAELDDAAQRHGLGCPGGRGAGCGARVGSAPPPGVAARTRGGGRARWKRKPARPTPSPRDNLVCRLM